MSFRERFRRAPASALAITASAAVATMAVVVMSLVLRLEPGWPPRLASGLRALIADPGSWGATWESLARPPAVYGQRALDALVRAVAQLGSGTIAIALLSLALHAAGRVLAQWRPLAVRCALGARLRHLMRQVATEFLVLGGLGCGLGAVAGGAVAAAMRATWPAVVSEPALLGAAGALAAMTAAILALLGAIALAFLYPLQRRAKVVADLHGDHITTPGGMLFLQNALASLQLAGLLVVTYASLLILSGNTGADARGAVPWSPDSLAVVPVRTAGDDSAAMRDSGLAGASDEGASRALIWRRLLGSEVTDRHVVGSSPDAWVGLGRELPVLGLCGSCFVGSKLVPVTHATARAQLVSPGALQALGLTPQRGGREFTAGDTLGAPKVVVLSHELAARLFPTPDVVGKPVWTGLGAAAAYRVIGVVPSIAPRGLGSSGGSLPLLYFSILQHPPARGELVLRTTDSTALPALRAAAGPDATIGAPEPLAARAHALDAPLGWFAALYGCLAAASTAIGLFALATVMTEVVTLRRRDIAIRLALGARPAHVVLWILGKALVVTGAGVLIGLSLARWVGDLMGAVTASETAGIYLLGEMVLGFGVVGILASLVPARRASRVQPASIWAEPGT